MISVRYLFGLWTSQGGSQKLTEKFIFQLELVEIVKICANQYFTFNVHTKLKKTKSLY